ncbi:MAG: FAD-dependent oxidoreductase [Pseudomonadota bacterium]
MTVTKNDIQQQFKMEVAAMPNGKAASRCFDCGSCTGVCPVSQSQTGFDPRKILHMIKLGLKDRLLASDIIWRCSHCDTCSFVCPQGVRFSAVVDILRAMAIEQGYVKKETFEQWGTGACKAACPAHISIAGFISAIAQGKYEDGLKLIREEMPFPGICGRVCPHPCEAKCNRGKVDEPVDIMHLKRFLADKDIQGGCRYIPTRKESNNKKVAIIGAGPAGLTAAYYLAIEGYQVTVFEKLPVAGGMMAVGIPEYRLPRDILEADIDVIRQLGVEIRLNSSIGQDITFAALQKDFNAVFVSVGCQEAIKLGIPGEETLQGVTDGITFLRKISLKDIPEAKGCLVVVGGGNAAIDSARVARRLGYDEVIILYRRRREEMPASSWEVDEAIEEGVDIRFLTAPLKLIGENGKVSGIECIKMEMGEPDESGRRRPVPIKGSEFVVKADTVVAAIGQRSDLSFLPKDAIPLSKRNTIEVDPLTVQVQDKIFAGGDVVSGPRTVVEAVAYGKRAARSIDLYLQGKDLKSDVPVDWKGMEYISENAQKNSRVSMPCREKAERIKSFSEVELGFTEQQARDEAARCLRICGMQRTKAI